MTIFVELNDKEYEINVMHYLVVPPYRGSAWNCDSDSDYYGYKEIEFEVLNDNGEPSNALYLQLTEGQINTIKKEIIKGEKNQYA